MNRHTSASIASLSPIELDRLADALADRIADRLASLTDADAMLDARGAAGVVGCSVATIERLTRSGEIPSQKIGRLRRYRRADLLGLDYEKGAADNGE